MPRFLPPLSRRHLIVLPLAAAVLPAGAQRARTPVLTVAGGRLKAPAVDGRFDFDLPALAALPQRQLATRTPWYREVNQFAGPLLRDVLVAAGVPASDGGRLRCTALNDYRVEIPLEDTRRFDVVLAHRLDGKPMPVREKGPLFIIYPFDERPELRTTTYYNRCIWQLRTLELL